MSNIAKAEDARPEPFEKEKARIVEARERWVERTPPVQVDLRDEDGKRSIKSPHNDDSGHTMRMGDALGSRSSEFIQIALTQLEETSRARGRPVATNVEINAALAIVSAIAPEDELETALAIQMTQNHFLSADLMGRANRTENLDALERYTNLSVKLQRTFTAQVEALARMRGKGQQTVRVEHVTVQAGAQAIVGDVHHHGPGRGRGQRRSKEQPHGTSQPTERAALPSPNPIGDSVPVPRDAKRALQTSRRTQPRRTPRE